MSSIAKLGDIAVGVCYAHKTPKPVNGNIISGTPTTLLNNKPVARIGDCVVFNCGHTGTIISGIPGCTCDGKVLAHIGSIVVGPMIATIVMGDPTSIGT